MDIRFLGSSDGHSGVEVYSKGLLSALEAEEVEQVEPAKLLKPHFLNHIFLNTPKFRYKGLTHISNQDLMSSLFLPKKGKIVVTVHDIFPYLGLSGAVYSLMSRLYLRNIEKKADKVIAISDFTKSQIVENTEIEEERITVVYQGVDLDRFRPTEPVHEEDYYLHVGSNIGRKNIEGLIEIFSIIREKKDVKLVRVGKPSKNIREKIIRLGLENDIIFETDINTNRLVNLYSGAEKLLFPSKAEGFGRPIIESMVCGTPVIAYNRAPMNEVLPECMLVECENQQRFAEKALKKQKFECRKLAENYSWDKTAKETIEVYRKLVEK